MHLALVEESDLSDHAVADGRSSTRPVGAISIALGVEVLQYTR
jgi:hypothetical protein